MSELRDRLERLAARGDRRGADDVLHGAIKDVHDVVSSGADAGGPDLEILDGDAPFVMPDPDVHRRGRYGTLVASFGAAALLGVGVLAVTAMFGSGGAGSPEGAVRQLADAVSHKDPLAAVDVLVPSEVRSMRETVKHITKRAADLKIVDNASAPLAGVDLSVDHLQLSTENLADGYAKVTVISGDLSTSTHRSAMSHLLQTAIGNTDATDFKGKVDLARLAANSDLPTFVVAVRHGGGWYVSPAYTALEYAREAANGPAAAYGSAKAAALGADTPEAAVSDALHAWQAGNWDRLMALAPPDELPVYDYRAWIDKEATDTHPDFTIDKLSTSATVDGDSAVVKLDASGTSGSGSDQRRWQVGGTCPGFRSYYSDTSASGSPELCLAGDLGGTIPFGLVLATTDVTASPTTGPVSIEVVREDGRWFVSPVSTALDLVDSTIDHVDENSLYPLIGLGYLLQPEGTITLDQGFALTGSRLAHVFSFDATAGQRIVGDSGASKDGRYFSGQLYTADGKDIGYVSFGPDFSGDPVTLPSTGSYRMVIMGYNVPDATRLTLWDAKNAPKRVLQPSDGGGFVSSPGEICTATPNGGESCTSQGLPSIGSTTPTAPRAPLATPTPATVLVPVPNGVTDSTEACRQTASGTTVCAGTATAVATTSVP